MGRPFNALIKLNAEQAPEFDFGQGSGGEEGSAEAVDFSGQESLGACPKCAGKVYQHGLAYVCEKSVGPERTCDFRSGQVILQQPIEREQMSKLLETGRTDLLKNFVSNRTRRKFSAFLVRDTAGKVGFEFEKREPKVATKTSTKKAAEDKPANPEKAPKGKAKASPKKPAAKK